MESASLETGTLVGGLRAHVVGNCLLKAALIFGDEECPINVSITIADFLPGRLL